MESWIVTSLKGWADALSCLYLSLATWKGTGWVKQSVSALAMLDGDRQRPGEGRLNLSFKWGTHLSAVFSQNHRMC